MSDYLIEKNLLTGGNISVAGDALFASNVTIEGWLEAPNVKFPCRGLFADEAALNEAFPHPFDGEFAYVGDSVPAAVYRAEGRRWQATGAVGGEVHFTITQAQGCDCATQLEALRGTTDALAGRMQRAEELLTSHGDDLEQLWNDLGAAETAAGNAQITATEALSKAEEAAGSAMLMRFDGFNADDSGYTGSGVSTQPALSVKYHSLYCHFEATVQEGSARKTVRRWQGAEKFNSYDADGTPHTLPDRLFLCGSRLYVSTTDDLQGV